jgi:hypothetical protein
MKVILRQYSSNLLRINFCMCFSISASDFVALSFGLFLIFLRIHLSYAVKILLALSLTLLVSLFSFLYLSEYAEQ